MKAARNVNQLHPGHPGRDAGGGVIHKKIPLFRLIIHTKV